MSEAKLTQKGLRVVSQAVISFFAVISLVSFLFTINRTLVVVAISMVMLLAALYLMWTQNETEAISLLIFFFGATSCFNFFTEVVTETIPKVISIFIFAILTLVLTNYLINAASPAISPERTLFKIILSIIFTEIFWVLSFINASQISKGAIAAVIFFNFQSVVCDILTRKFQLGKFIFLLIISISLLTIVFYKI